MNTLNDLINEIKKMAPSRTDLIKLGVSENYIEKELSSYNLIKINEYIDPKIEGLKPLDEFILCYNLESFAVKMISFPNKLDRNRLGIIIGYCEQDTLIFNRKDFSISMYERNTSFKMGLCAKSVSGFMEALLIMLKHSTKCNDYAFADDMNERKKSCLECVKVAGGSETTGFYSTCFGV